MVGMSVSVDWGAAAAASPFFRVSASLKEMSVTAVTASRFFMPLTMLELA